MMPNAATSTLRPRPHRESAIAGCRGDPNRSEVAISEPVLDAPIVIVEEIHMHGGGPPSPTIAIWADGQMLFADASEGGTASLLASKMSMNEAAAIARDVYRELDGVPRSTTVLDISSGTLLQITVRGGDHWRSASVFGDDPERVLAVARGTAAPPKPAAPPSFNNPPNRIEEIFANRPWPPLGFARAYRSLIEKVPSAGRAFTVHDFDVLFITPERGMKLQRPALDWPIDLPRPPANVNLAACHYYMDRNGECRFMLTASDNPAVERFKKKMWTGDNQRAVNINGAAFAVRFDWMYRGERTIDAVTRCSATLSSNATH
jgi:hypothetical protein